MNKLILKRFKNTNGYSKLETNPIINSRILNQKPSSRLEEIPHRSKQHNKLPTMHGRILLQNMLFITERTQVLR